MPSHDLSGQVNAISDLLEQMRDDIAGLPDDYHPLRQQFRQLIAQVDTFRNSSSQIKTSVSRYRDLFDAIDEGFCVIEVLFDADGQAQDYRFLEVNAAFERQTGINNSVGRLMREIAPQHEDYWFEIYGKVAQTGESIRFENYAEQLQRYYDLYAFRVDDPSEHHVAVLFNDITARKQLERARAEMLSRERQARFEAERAVSMQRQFLGMISHELRTPLASIKGFSSSLLATDVYFDDDEVQEFLGIIDAEADTLAGLIDQLLDIVRMQAGTLRLTPVPATVTEIVVQVQPQLNRLAFRHALRIDIPADLPPVQADARRIGQVLTNLVGNAVKFSPTDTAIRVTASYVGDAVQFDVIDEGEGIPLDQRNAVFDVFHQIRTGPGRQQGSGLGLAICKMLVESHGGRIWVADHPGRGTIVSFTLPLATSPNGKI